MSLLLALLAFAYVITASSFDANLGTPTNVAAKAGASLPLEFSLTNKKNVPVTVSKLGTPLDDCVFCSKLFDIVNADGVPAVYLGKRVKRQPGASDVVTLQPGQTVTKTLDLYVGWAFTEAGAYLVTLNTILSSAQSELEWDIIYTGSDSAGKLLNLDSLDLTPYTIIVPDSLVTPLSELHARGLGLPGDHALRTKRNIDGKTTANLPGFSYDSCTADQITQIEEAIGHARSDIARTITYLAKPCNDDEPYVVWFGLCDTVDPSKYQTIRDHFANVHALFQSGFTVACTGDGCTDDKYAFVSPDSLPLTMHVCGLFWSAPAVECGVVDTRAGTLIHESTHFTIIADTDDVVYGTLGCQNLAFIKPNFALRNADTHERMAEQCPLLYSKSCNC